MNPPPVPLVVLPDPLAICRLAPDAAWPGWATGPLVSITRTPDEVSVVCPAGVVPAGIRVEAPWRAFRVAGTLDFGLTGILASLSGTLAATGVPCFALSTFDTDYLLVREPDLDRAMEALARAGHAITDLATRNL